MRLYESRKAARAISRAAFLYLVLAGIPGVRQTPQ
jgi:hypothetical protein